jgi:predicted chitinase
MTDENKELDELDRQQTTSTKELTGAVGNFATNDLEKFKNAIKARQLAAKKQAAEIKRFTDTVGQAGGQLTRNESGDFSAINGTIDLIATGLSAVAELAPVIGGALSGAVKIAAEASKFIIEEFQKVYGAFEKTSGTGVITRFEDLKTASDATGLLMTDAAELLGKHSKTLALFGGSAKAGAKRFQNIAADSQEISREYQTLGIGIKEFAEQQIDYIEQHRRGNDFLKKSDQEIQQGTIAYIDRINMLSKITGKTREELKKEFDDNNRNAKYLYGTANLPDEIKDNVDSIIAQFTTWQKEGGEGIRDILSANGVAITEQAQTVAFTLQQGGFDVEAEAKKVRTGEQTDIEFILKAKEALGKAVDQVGDQAAAVGGKVKLYNFMIGASEAKTTEAKALMEQLETAKKERDNARKLKGQGSNLAKVRRDQYEIGRKVQNTILSGPITGALESLSNATNKTTKIIYDALGKKLPPDLEAREKEAEAVAKTNKLRAELEELEKEQLEKQNKVKSTQPGTKENSEAKKEYEATQTGEAKVRAEYLKRQLANAKKEEDAATARRVKLQQEAGGSAATRPKTGGGAAGGTAAGGTAGGGTAGGGTSEGSSSGGGATGGTSGGNTSGGNTSGGNTSGNTTASPGVDSSSSGGTSGGTTASEAAGGMPAGSGPTTVGQNQQLMLQAMNDLGVTDSTVRAAMMAAAEGESGFKLQNEIAYDKTSNENIRKSFGAGSVFGKMPDDQLTKLKADPVKFFDYVYGGRYGNGPIGSGDGYKYRGRGFIGITFKGVYEKYGKALNIDLVGNPDLANDPKIAAKIAVQLMLDGMKKNPGADLYTQVARSIGNANEITEKKKEAAFKSYSASGQFAAGKKADLSFLKNTPTVAEVKDSGTPAVQPTSVASTNAKFTPTSGTPGPGDPKPVAGSAARTGGIMSGPSTGYLVEMHGDEIIIPANDGAQATQLQEMLGGIKEEDISMLFEMMSKKLDAAISAASGQVSTQTKSRMMGFH